MAIACEIIPKVKNNKGDSIESPLFKDLLEFTGNRKWAADIYEYTKTQNFRDRFEEVITYQELVDNNGNREVTSKSLLENLNIFRLLDEKDFMDILSTRYKIKGVDNKEKGFTFNQAQLIQKKFREDSSELPWNNYFLMKRVKYYKDRQGQQRYRLVIYPLKYQENLDSSALRNRESKLFNKLQEILSKWGVAVGSLTSLEERLQYNGVMDTTSEQIIDGLKVLIRLAKGHKGIRALPEEFAHFAIEALGDNNQEVQKLKEAISGHIQDILGSEYQIYQELYKGNEELLIKEAMGKLLAAHINNNENVQSPKYKTLLQKLWEAIKNIFSRAEIKDIDSLYSTFASDLLSGKFDTQINLDNLKPTVLYQTEDKVNRDKKILEKIRDTYITKLNLLEKKKRNHKITNEEFEILENIEDSLDKNEELEGIFNYLQYILQDLKTHSANLKAIYREYERRPINETATYIRDIRNSLASNKEILQMLNNQLREEELEENNRLNSKLRERLKEVMYLQSSLWEDYNRIGLPLFSKVIKPFIGDSLKFRGKNYKIDDYLTIAEKDITVFDRWLDAAAESGDFMVKILDQLIKDNENRVKESTLDIVKDIEVATIKLNNSGIKDTSWMYERDSKGNLTGNYKNKYSGVLTPSQVTQRTIEINKWQRDNIDPKTGLPDKFKYESKQFREIKNNKVKLEYYDFVMSLKKKLDSYLPPKIARDYQAVMIRKDLLERVKDSIKGNNNPLQILGQSLKDTFLIREDDVNWGVKTTIKDFENREVKTLPIYYTKRLDNMNDLSLDTSSTLAAYTQMAIRYREFSKSLDILELGRDIARDRIFKQQEKNAPLKQVITFLGRKIESDVQKQGDNSLASSRIDDLFNMQVFGEYQKDQGTFGNTKVSKGKTADFINQMSSLSTMALSGLTSLANVLTGSAQITIEAASKEFFTPKTLFKADLIYGKQLPQFLGQIGNKTRTNKLALFCEKFDVQQDYEKRFRNLNLGRSKFSKLFSLNTLFFLQNAGEHWMSTRTALATALNTFFYDKNTKEKINLWDALVEVPIISNGRKIGMRLELRPNLVTKEGKEVTNKDLNNFSRKVARINQRLQGIYNNADKSAIQQGALGRLAIMYRKWMKPAFNRRYAKANYDYDLEAWTEGYYRTSWEFLKQLGKDIKQGQFNIIANFNKLDNLQKYNLRRAMAEVGQFIVILGLIALLESKGGDDDDEKSWFTSTLEYSLRRLKTELGVLIPSQYAFDEIKRIGRSPAAGFDYLQRLSDILEVFNWFDEVEYGTYKGQYKITRDLLKVLPVAGPLYKSFNPEEVLQFYK